MKIYFSSESGNSFFFRTRSQFLPYKIYKERKVTTVFTRHTRVSIHGTGVMREVLMQTRNSRPTQIRIKKTIQRLTIHNVYKGLRWTMRQKQESILPSCSESYPGIKRGVMTTWLGKKNMINRNSEQTGNLPHLCEEIIAVNNIC